MVQFGLTTYTRNIVSGVCNLCKISIGVAELYETVM